MTLPPGSREARRVGGGHINEAYRLLLADGREAFVKTRSDPHPGEYEAEAEALAWLAEAGSVAVPEVLEADERYLALEWIEEGSLDANGAEAFGEGLARLHAAGAARFGDPGTLGPARLGSVLLPNDPTGTWAEFYVERRLLPLVRLAGERGALSAGGIETVEAVCGRMGELAGPSEPPARLHGDLWSGNVIADRRGRPHLVDPSAYGGSREVDLAMLRLFGAPHLERMLAAYAAAFPPAEGWKERVALHQLLPLLVHAALFGGSYGAAAERAARRYM